MTYLKLKVLELIYCLGRRWRLAALTSKLCGQKRETIRESKKDAKRNTKRKTKRETKGETKKEMNETKYQKGHEKQLPVWAPGGFDPKASWAEKGDKKGYEQICKSETKRETNKDINKDTKKDTNNTHL